MIKSIFSTLFLGIILCAGSNIKLDWPDGTIPGVQGWPDGTIPSVAQK